MKVMKSLLLGAAAGLVATAGAQAADLPVKAKPVEYVKVCSAYGAGFYYIPGTDICLRVGGYVYYEFGVKGNNAVANIYASSRIDANYNYYNSRTSARINLDARQQTAYGTLRAFMSTGGNFNANHVNITSWDAAFIQFAGFTWGYTNSFFSFGYAGYGIVASPMTDWSWINTFAYTAQLGNGLTASIAVEDPSGRRANIGGPTVNGIAAGYGGRWMPDVVGNFNVTQAWGRAQIMGAVHEVKPNNGMINNGADTEYGYALGAGIEVKTPQTGNANNSFLLQGAWTKGATDYTGYNSSPTAGATSFTMPKHVGLGPAFTVTDAVANATGGLDLTKAWSVYGAYRHYWTPALRSALGAGWLEIDEGNGVNSQGEVEVFQANLSTVWSPVAGLDLSLDLVYSDVEQTTVAGVKRSNDIWTAWTRLRRNF